MKERILSTIEGRCNQMDKLMEDYKKSMESDFMSFFKNDCKETYKTAYISRVLKKMKESVEEENDMQEILCKLKNERDFYLTKLTTQELYPQTTNQMYNLALMVEMNAAQYLYKFYSVLLTSLRKTGKDKAKAEK